MLVIPDMESDPELALNPVCVDFQCRFYAASPLITASGVPLGTFCIMDPLSNADVGFDKPGEAILSLMASAVMSQLELAFVKRKSDQLHRHVLSAISHELRTPIHGILGLCESFEDVTGRRPSPLQAKVVDEIRGEAHDMMSLVNDMLESAEDAQSPTTPSLLPPTPTISRSLSVLPCVDASVT